MRCYPVSTAINHVASEDEECSAHVEFDDGNTLAWNPGNQPGLGEQLVHVPLELNLEKFDKMFVDLMTRPTPGAHQAGR